MKILTSERGSILLYTMLTMAVMMAMGLTLSSLFVSRFKAATAARETITALYVADGAVERCLYEARQEVSGPAGPLTFQTDSTFTIQNSANGNLITNDCSILGSKSFAFRATGQFRNTRRTLEVTQ